MQTAYRIIARLGKREVWNSGKVMSHSMTHIKYAGAKLQSRDRIDWEVTPKHILSFTSMTAEPNGKPVKQQA